MKKDLFGDAPIHTISTKKDPYATLEGSGWELEPVLDTPKDDGKPMDIKTLLEMLKANPSEHDIQHMVNRLEHFRMKTSTRTIDTSCLDIAYARQDLDEVLHYYRSESMWSEYKYAYDLGIELIDRLGYILSVDPILPLQEIIQGLMYTMDDYKAIRETDECLL